MKSAEPQKIVTLLWRHHSSGRPQRGPVPKLTTDKVVEAAIAFADAEGLQFLTMRELGKRLKAPAMTLYTHVLSRAVLTELMIDGAYLHMEREIPSSKRWQDQLWSVARDNRRLLATHPWILEVAGPRTVLGPGALGKYEYELNALQEAGLNDIQTDLTLTMLLGVVEHSVRIERARAGLEHESGLSDDAWWENVGPVLTALYDPADYPLATRIGSASGEAYGGATSGEHSFSFGVTGVIASVTALQT